MERYDLIIIGGGINGAAICRDASLRGMKVLLLEKSDFAAGASGHNGRMIHGGLRYLKNGDLGLVIEALRERSTLLRIAPHLVQRTTLMIPVRHNARHPAWMIRLGLLLLDGLALGRFPAHRWLDRDGTVLRVPCLRADGLRGSMIMHDAYAEHAERLTLENVLAGAEAGASVRNRCPVTGIEAAEGGGLRVRWQEAGAAREASAPAVVNTTGAWTDALLSGAAGLSSALTTGAMGSFIVFDGFDGAPKEAVFLESRVDGRPVLVTPWLGCILVGTTDVVIAGDVDSAKTTEAEIDYLLDVLKEAFRPGMFKRSDIRFTYSGVRPLPAATGPSHRITRKHVIHRHKAPLGGLFSVYGGKLSTFRSLAQEATDTVCSHLGRKGVKSRTARTPLPGARSAAGLQLCDLPEKSRARLAAIYGSRAARIGEMMRDRPELAEIVDAESGALAAELVFAVREEFARSLSDILLRRTMLGYRVGRGRKAIGAFRRVAATHLGWSKEKIAADIIEYENYLAATSGSRFQRPTAPVRQLSGDA